jgi:hypothetical protein
VIDSHIGEPSGFIEKLKARSAALLFVGALAVAKFLNPDIEQREWVTTVPSATEVDYYKDIQLIAASTAQLSGIGIAEHNNPPTTAPDWIGVSAPNPPGGQETTELVPVIQPSIEFPVHDAPNSNVAQAEQTTASSTSTEIVTPTVTVPFAQDDTSDRATTLPAGELSHVTEAIEPEVIKPEPQGQYLPNGMDIEGAYPYYELEALPNDNDLVPASDPGYELVIVAFVLSGFRVVKNYALLGQDSATNHSPFGNQG